MEIPKTALFKKHTYSPTHGETQMIKKQITVRRIVANELARIAELEQQIWSKEGADIFDINHIKSWFKLNRASFLVAIVDGLIVGYAFAQIMRLNSATIKLPSTYMKTVDDGFCKTTHDKKGNFHFCITVCSINPGAGRALINALSKQASKSQKPLLGVSRIIGFSEYLFQTQVLNPQIIMGSAEKLAIAWHYAKKTAIMVGGTTTRELAPLKTKIIFPEITSPDPVLAGYLKSKFSIVRPLIDFIKDPKSGDFGILCRQI